MHIIRTASVSMHGSLFSSGGMIGSVYIMVSGGKCMMTCVSSGMVRIVIVSWFSFVARQAQCMAFCMFFLLCGWAYPLLIHLCLKAMPLDPNMESLWNGE
jgi:hypothetical protein